jgi:hypothetical protein
MLIVSAVSSGPVLKDIKVFRDLRQIDQATSRVEAERTGAASMISNVGPHLAPEDPIGPAGIHEDRRQ